MTDFSLLRQANDARHRVWPGSRAGSEAVDFSTIEFAGEVGELLQSISESLLIAETTSDADMEEVLARCMDNIKDELGDVIISMDLLARDLGISLDDASLDVPEGAAYPAFDAFDENTNFLMLLVRIGGTTARIVDPVKKLLRIHRGIAGNKPGVSEEDLKARVREGMQDLVHLLGFLASDLDVTVRECVPRKFNRTSHKVGVHCYMDPNTWVWFYSSAMPKESN